MIIRVLPELNQRQQWIEFCRREKPYCFVESPECLIDFQSTYLQITLLPKNTLIRDAVKYSLGSRNSMEPVWRLIKACNWDLNGIIRGMESMDFSSNVRDNSLLQVHTDLTARKFFARERYLAAPSTIGLLQPLTAVPDIWDAESLAQMISHQQFSELRSEQKLLPSKKTAGGVRPPSVQEIMLILLDPVEQCIGQMDKKRLHIYRGKQPFISLTPQLGWPKPRLRKQDERKVLK